MTSEPPRRSLARLALFVASFAFAVLLGSFGEASRRGLWPLAALGLVASGWMVYLACLWLVGRTLRRPGPGKGIDPKSGDVTDLAVEAALLLGPEEAERLMKTLSPGQMRLFLDRRKPGG